MKKLNLVRYGLSLLGWLGWLACLLAPATALASRWATLADPVFQRLMPEQGLPRGFSFALAQDASGFIWIASPNGLARWDGYRARIYLPRERDVHSLPDAFVQSLHVDTRGRLWVGTSGGGLARYEAEQDHFIRIPTGSNGLSNIGINSIADDGAGGLWIGTDRGLNHISADGNTITQLHQKERDLGDLTEARIRVILRSTDGNLWLGGPTGLLLRKNGDRRFQKVRSGTELPVSSLFQDKSGKLWIGSEKNGIWWRDPANGQIQKLAIEAGDVTNANLASSWITAIAEPRPGELWFGSFGQGIIRLHNGSLQHIEHDPALPYSLSDNSVFDMLRDRSGLLWLATNRGINRIDLANQAVLTLSGLRNHPQKVSDPDVRSLMTLPDGTVWLGLSNNGVDIIDPERGRIHALRPNPQDPQHALQGDRVWAMLATGPNTVYLGTDRGLYRANADGSHLVQVKLEGRTINTAVRTLLMDGNYLYVGTLDGLWLHDLIGQPGLLRMRPKGAEQLFDQRIGTMKHGPDGSIWIGTRSGLHRYQPQTGQLQSFLPNADDPGALSPGIVSSLLFDAKNRLWVGSLEGGINLLEPGSNRFRHLRGAQGLANDAINCLLPDKKGNIWASTDDGLAVINSTTLKIRPLQRADGVVLATHWGGSCGITSKGELLFGANGGVNVVRPDELANWHWQAPVVLSEIRVGNRPVPAQRFSQNNDAPIAPLEIAFDNNSLSVEFAALDFSAPEKNRYAYQLEGYDSDWSETDATHRLASWAKLPPGPYLLRIRGSNRNGEFNPQERQIPIRVAPAWYQTWWWHTLEALCALALLFGIIHLRTRFLNKNRLLLARQVAQRTTELEQNREQLVRTNLNLNRANDDLAQSAETLRELSRIGRDITANLDLEAAFDTLHQHLLRLIDAPSLIIFRFNPDALQLELVFGREFGRPLPPHTIALNSLESNSAQTARERRELLIEVKPTPDNPNPPLTSRQLMTSLYIPLIVDHRLLGVMSAQSGLPHAYGERERLIFRNLCAYGSIALDNANAYRQLQQAQTKLVEQEKLAALGSLVAGVAHELNTPIGNSLLMLSTLEDKTAKFQDKVSENQLRKSDLQEYLSDVTEASVVIMRGLNSAADLVSSFKQVAVDRTSAQQRLFNLSHTCHEIIATLSNQLKLAGHQIEVQIDPAIHLNSYPGPFGQVITHLVDNALLHAFEADTRGKMQLSAHMEGIERVIIEFRDDGKGILPDHLKRIFEPFFTTKMGQGGGGLGLSISYNIVTSLLNGSIRVDSQPGQGCCFTLDLPVQAPAR
jgi:ligand-binding sensor domain-containing protein/signal transduction histidine kinase